MLCQRNMLQSLILTTAWFLLPTSSHVTTLRQEVIDASATIVSSSPPEQRRRNEDVMRIASNYSRPPLLKAMIGPAPNSSSGKTKQKRIGASMASSGRTKQERATAKSKQVPNLEHEFNSAHSTDKGVTKSALTLGPLYPVAMGSLLAVSQVAGPDHLCTLFNLGAGLDPIGGFKVGASFGAGHSAGMLLMCALIMPLGRVIDLRQWEHYGDYFIGLSMVLVGVYFLISRAKHLELQSDGTYVPLGCGCHTEQKVKRKLGGRRVPLRHQFCAGFGSNIPPKDAATASNKWQPPVAADVPTEILTEGMAAPPPPTAPAPTQENSVAPPVSVDSQGGIIGLMQGACCPLGLIGAGLVGKMGVNDNLSMTLFVISFVLGSVIGTGLFMLVWVFFAQRGLSSFVSLKTIYDLCSVITIMLGVGWVVGNYFGLLEEHAHSM